MFIQQILMENNCWCLGYIQGCTIPSLELTVLVRQWGRGKKINTNIVSKLYCMLESPKSIEEKKERKKNKGKVKEINISRGKLGGKDRPQC